MKAKVETFALENLNVGLERLFYLTHNDSKYEVTKYVEEVKTFEGLYISLAKDILALIVTISEDNSDIIKNTVFETKEYGLKILRRIFGVRFLSAFSVLLSDVSVLLMIGIDTDKELLASMEMLLLEIIFSLFVEQKLSYIQILLPPLIHMLKRVAKSTILDTDLKFYKQLVITMGSALELVRHMTSTANYKRIVKITAKVVKFSVKKAGGTVNFCTENIVDYLLFFYVDACK